MIPATQTVDARAQVLLIDDDDFMTVTLPHYLAKRDCDVVTVRTRTEAERLLTDGTYDLIVVDPYMTGETTRDTKPLLEMMRRHQPASRIVLISAYTSSEMVAAAEACGVVAVLTKPQSPIFLSQLVVSALKSSSTELKR
jgi:DNA-binding NtrC family response regulator